MIKLKKHLLFIAFIFSVFTGSSQEFKYFESPENFQLYAREKNDSATITVHGELDKGLNYDEILLKVFKDNVLFDTQKCDIRNKQFSAKSQIDAGLHNFRFELQYKKDKKEYVIIVADSVVCGDAYIITGQSNSHASSSFSTFKSPFCSSFGVKTGYEPYSDEDKKVRWGQATGNCHGLNGVGGWFTKIPFGVGVWGMELARLIVEKHHVPVCIINGGSGSSSIEENMLYPEIPSLETSFGRLAYRVNQAGLKDKVKAIFYHQGETNSDERYTNYATSFDVLYNDWKRVYTGLQKIYLFQLHPGCGGNFQSELREIQHQIAAYYEDVEIMSTTGVVGHDGCHFSTEGYYEFAHRILPLVSRDFYNEKTNKIITPPTLVNVYYSSLNEIVLEFNQVIKLDEKQKVNNTEYFMKDQFFFGINGKDEVVSNMVENIDVQYNRIILRLKAITNYHNITWLPNKNYLDTNVCYQGPWIRGAENNIGALSFDRWKINPLKNPPKN